MAVAEAASELGVSDRRIRQMLADGRLPGERAGRSWVLDELAVQEFAKSRSGAGRPWKPSSAWDVLAMAEGSRVPISPVDRHRAQKRLELGIGSILGQLANRAERHWFYAHPSVLEAILEHPRFVATGISALASNHIDLVIADQIEGYAPKSELAGLIDQFALDSESERPNALLRVANDDCWPFAPRQRHAPTPVVAIDLLDSADERSRRAGRDLLNRL